jgi:hypothetical protein
MSLGRTQLYFGVTRQGALTTPPQQIAVEAANFPSGTTWTVSADQPWLVATKDSTGRAVAVAVRPGTYGVGSLSGVITVSGAGLTRTVPVSLTGYATVSQAWGALDTPANGATNVTGSIPVTGWVMHQIAVKQVDIYRDPIGNEPSASGLVLVGTAVPVEGARPDIEAAAALPFNYRAGWGLMVLSNVLPNHGNGTYTFHALATAIDGTISEVGRKTVTCANATATLPFGTIDTPGQGETVSGTIMNWGWALAPQPSTINPDGSGLEVYVDGQLLGHPTYGQNRADIAGLFPGLMNSTGAIGYLAIDTTRFTNGVHTIGWIVRDQQGHGEGIGSRFFNVQNSSTPALTVATIASASGDALTAAAARTAAVVRARVGFDGDAPFLEITPGEGGGHLVAARELDRVEVALGAAGDGATMLIGNRAGPLPAGSRFDAATGIFIWQPGVGFAGRYDFVFTRGAESVPVTIVISPKHAATSDALITIDTPITATTTTGVLRIAGWAIDRGASHGTGIDAVHVWAYRAEGGTPVFLGQADYGGSRPDVGAALGRRFEASGYALSTALPVPGTYDIVVFPHSVITQAFADAKVVRIIVR